MAAIATPELLSADTDELAELLAVRLLDKRCRIFLTGEAGTGKTHLTKAVLARLGSTALVTAFTGVAALQLDDGNAQTLHRALNLPVLPERASPVEAMQQVLAHYQGILLGSTTSYIAEQTRKRVTSHDVLVIDEVGMLPPELLEHVDLALRICRRQPDEPFGGMGILAVGDMLQLPPVKSSMYVFHAPVWAVFDTVLLRKVHRQIDNDLAPLLESLRTGRPPQGEALRIGTVCEARMLHPAVKQGPCITLMPTKRMVASENEQCLQRLLRQPHNRALLVHTISTPLPFSTSGRPDVVEELAESVASELHCRGAVTQKWSVGMRVMFTKNHTAESRIVKIDDKDKDSEKPTLLGLVNGDTGTIVGFYTPSSGSAKAGVGAGKFPLVQPDRFPDHRVEVCPQEWRRSHCVGVHRDQEGRPTGHTDACFSKVSAIPMIPAWAMTFHKAQGVTVPSTTKVIVHTADRSAAGSIYVAASRVRQSDQLVFVGSGWRNPVASGEARQFFATLVRRTQQALDQKGSGLSSDGAVWLPGVGAAGAVSAACRGLAGPEAVRRLALAACCDPKTGLAESRQQFGELATKAASAGMEIAVDKVVMPVLRELAARFPDFKAAVGPRKKQQPAAEDGDAAGAGAEGPLHAEKSLLWKLLLERARAEDKGPKKQKTGAAERPPPAPRKRTRSTSAPAKPPAHGQNKKPRVKAKSESVPQQQPKPRIPPFVQDDEAVC